MYEVCAGGRDGRAKLYGRMGNNWFYSSLSRIGYAPWILKVALLRFLACCIICVYDMESGWMD